MTNFLGTEDVPTIGADNICKKVDLTGLMTYGIFHQGKIFSLE